MTKRISVELSKALHYLDLRRKSERWWVRFHDDKVKESDFVLSTWCDDYPTVAVINSKRIGVDGDKLYAIITKSRPFDDKAHEVKEKYAAYTLDEILEMLPYELPNDGEECWLFLNGENNNKYTISYSGEDILLHEFEHENPAEAAGLLLEWCIKNRYVTVEDIT